MISIYKPETIIYYGKINNNNKLTPAPDFDISLEYQYVNDTIIGYNYELSLKGNAMALDLSNLNYGELYNIDNYEADVGAVIDSINKIRKILSQNGNILYVVRGSTGQPILRAKGGKLRSLTFDESSNNWKYYCPYTATIAFDSIDFGNKTESCDKSFLDPLTFSSKDDAGIVNINKYKINSFNDSWSFTFDENDAFEKGYIKSHQFNNSSFNISYNINATGKNYYKYSNPDSSSASTLSPAWEQARNFVQYRLHNQVKTLISGVLENDYTQGCSSDDDLSEINIPGATQGLLKDLANYAIYNETITCDMSEAEGSFSASYSSIVKNTQTSQAYGSPQTKHTIKKSHNIDDSELTRIHTISVDGEIQGLVEGGLIHSHKPLTLPEKGSLFIVNNNNYVTKYDRALEVLNKIYSPSDYNNGIGENGKRDLKPAFKTLLDITAQALETVLSENDPLPDPPHAVSLDITHDYINGSINYTAEYKTNTNPYGRISREITIDTDIPTKVVATFDIPNSNQCSFIQDLSTYTTKTTNVTINGIDLSANGKPPKIDFNTIFNCGSCFSEEYFPITIPMPEGSIITQKTHTHNPLDGTFTINLTYICSEGCNI